MHPVENECVVCLQGVHRFEKCHYGHIVCLDCKNKINRKDCILCNPMTKKPPSQQNRLSPSLNWLRNRPVHLTYQQKIIYGLVDFLLGLFSVAIAAVFVCCVFMLDCYVGKAIIWCFLQLGDGDEPEWFSWKPGSINLLEFFIGMFGLIFLVIAVSFVPIFLDIGVSCLFRGRSRRRGRFNRVPLENQRQIRQPALPAEQVV